MTGETATAPGAPVASPTAPDGSAVPALRVENLSLAYTVRGIPRPV